MVHASREDAPEGEPPHRPRRLAGAAAHIADAVDTFFGRPWLVTGVAAVFIVGALALAFWMDRTWALLGVTFLAVVAVVAGTRLFQVGKSLGYETIRLELEYDFQRTDGSLVLVRSRSRVRLLHDAAALTIGGARAEGAIGHVASSGGRVVDRFDDEDGRRWAVLSFGTVKRRGEHADLEVTRTLLNPFQKRSESLLVTPAGRPRVVSIRMLFPPERPCSEVRMLRQKRSGKRKPDGNFTIEQAGARKVLAYAPRRPREDDSYVIEWVWPPLEIFVSHPESLTLPATRLAELFEANGIRARTSGPPAAVARAPRVVLLVDGKPPDDRLRLEWEAAVGIRTIVVAIGGARVPERLRGFGVLRLETGETITEATFERLRATLWHGEEGEVPAELPSDEEVDVVVSALQADAEAAREREAPRAVRRLQVERDRLKQKLAQTSDDGTRGSLAYALGMSERQLGELESARVHFRLAAEAFERAFGASDTKLAEATFNVGMVSAELGAAADAERWLARAVEIGERAFEQDDARMRLFKAELDGSRSAREVS